MKKTTRFITSLITLGMLLSIGTTAMAAVSPTETAVSQEVYQDMLQEAIKDTPEGYHLESFEVTLNKQEISEPALPEQATTYSFGDYIGSTSYLGDVYFPSQPFSSDWYQGPLASATYTASQTFSGTWNGNVGVSVKVVEANLGFSTTSAQTFSRNFSISSVPSNQKVNVKVYGNYAKYAYYVYTMQGQYKATGYAYKPIGLYVTQTRYTK